MLFYQLYHESQLIKSIKIPQYFCHYYTRYLQCHTFYERMFQKHISSIRYHQTTQYQFQSPYKLVREFHTQYLYIKELVVLCFDAVKSFFFQPPQPDKSCHHTFPLIDTHRHLALGDKRLSMPIYAQKVQRIQPILYLQFRCVRLAQYLYYCVNLFTSMG